MKKKFLHPLKQQPKFRTKDFSVAQSGTTATGVRLQSFEARNPAIHSDYRHGIMVEYPGKPAIMVYGSYNDINAISHQIKSDPDAVARSIRPLGEAQSYSLNKPLSSPSHVQPTKQEVDRYSTAQAMFGKDERESALLD